MPSPMDELAAMLEKQNKLLTGLVERQDAMDQILKTANTGNNVPLMHGNGGIFANPAIERDVIVAHVRPFGIGNRLPLLPSVIEDPRFASLTGYTATTGAEPTEACADAPRGYVKGCLLTARFGMIRRDTGTIDIEKAILQWNRGDTRDLMLRGRVLGLANLAPSGINESDMLNILTKSEMVTAAVNAEKKISRDMWQGTIAGGTFPGLDQQIATGQKDADTGVLCPALDSDIKNFNYDLLGGTGRDIVEFVSSMMWYLEYNAMTMGLDPVSFVLVMRPELWFELTAVWPCSYLSNRCKVGSTTTNIAVINDDANVSMRDAMRKGMYLTVNGIDYPVVVDTGIYEKNNVNTATLTPGQYASSIYAVPMTITGGFPVTYREYLNFRAGASEEALLNSMNTFWTDDGIYSWAIENIKWCYKLSLKTEQRVVLRTPQLAGKIQNIKYVPLQHLRETYPDSQYNFDGGVSVRGQTGAYTPWS